MKKLSFLALALCSASLFAQERKAPAYPLITHDPYFSIWSQGDKLNENPTKHWTGVNQSLNGVLMVDGKYYNFLGETEKVYKTILPAADEKAFDAKYAFEEPAKGWQNISFDDSNWKTGAAPFGFEKGESKTQWKTKTLWVRRTFDLTETDFNKVFLKVNHDEDIQVFINGKIAYEKVGWTDEFAYLPIRNSLLQKGRNTIAIKIVNKTGGQWLDFGLVEQPAQKEAITLVNAVQKNVNVAATQTTYDFTCGPVDLTVIFTSPLLMDDLDLMARPVSYITTKIKANDGKTHDAKLYIGASSDLAVHSTFQPVTAVEYSRNDLNILKAGTIAQPFLQRSGDGVRIDWGYMYLAVPTSANATQNISSQANALNILVDKSDDAPLERNGQKLKLNTVIPFGKIGDKTVEQYVMLGYDDLFSFQYFHDNLRPWWNLNGTETIENQLGKAANQYKLVMEKCAAFDAKMYNDAKVVGGESYAKLLELAYRQAISAHKLSKSPDGDILFMSKENYSNGSINTVDITYPSAPLFLLYNPDLVKGMMNGIFYYSESGRWKKPFAAHDLGTYPIANGQTYGEDMPIEESGNMVILAGAIAKAEGNADYAKAHWATLTTWAEYLAKEGFDPANQLSTDDFAGHLARNTNLSIKAIVALGSYGMMAKMLGKNDVAEKYTKIAKDMAIRWDEMADAGDHYSLSFGKKDTWSQKYNLVWDKILDLNIFPEKIYKKEVSFYLKHQNKYGLPLDSREDYTKSDWVTWTATLTDNKQDFEAFIDPIYKFALETPARSPLTDWHGTKDGLRMNFTARSVIGGYFMKLLEVKFKAKK